MPFLVLTRSGFLDLQNKDLASGALLYANPGIVSIEESDALRANGITVQTLLHTVDPLAELSVREAIRFISSQHTDPLWLEATSLSVVEKPLSAEHTSPPATTSAERKRFHEHLLHGASQALFQLRKMRSSGKKLLILPYLGYGNAHGISLRGRVLEDEGSSPQEREASGWENLIALYKRLESDQVPGARVLARIGGIEREIVTDKGGYFSVEMALPQPLDSAGWHTVELVLLEPASNDGSTVSALGSVLIPPASARFGVISDIDDTVLWTNVTNKLNMLLMLARSNAHTRKPFKGVAAFYRALHEGASGDECNPIFYVSSSPWHLFEPLLDFLRMQDIPVGPLMLKELGLRKLFGSERHSSHKLENIARIVRMYPQLQFVLIGDSGEQDPEIYGEVVRRYPKAVRAIYIRNVNPDPSRVEAIDRLIAEVRATGTQLILSPDSEFAATHAAAEGLIKARDMVSIRIEKEIDETPNGRIDQLIDQAENESGS